MLWALAISLEWCYHAKPPGWLKTQSQLQLKFWTSLQLDSNKKKKEAFQFSTGNLMVSKFVAMLAMAADVSGTAKLNLLSRCWSKLRFFYSSHKIFCRYCEWAETNDPFFSPRFPSRSLRNPALRFWQPSPPVCVQEVGAMSTHSFTHSCTHAMNESYQGIHTNHPSTFQQILGAASPLLSSVMAMPDCKVTVYGHPGP